MELAPAVDRLLAESEIRDVIYTYCRGVDRFELELVRDCYHEDGIDDHGIFRGDRDAYVGWLAERLPGYLHSSHTIGNILIRQDGDSAWVESYCTVRHRLHDKQGELIDRIGDLRYVDRFERRDARWRIALRRVIWATVRIERGTAAPPAEGAITARRDREDPSYDPV